MAVVVLPPQIVVDPQYHWTLSLHNLCLHLHLRCSCGQTRQTRQTPVVPFIKKQNFVEYTRIILLMQLMIYQGFQ